MNHADVTWVNNEFAVTGNLDFSNVMSVYKKALPQFNAADTLVFNFADLKTSNSAGIALIVEWMRYAKSANKHITFRHISPELHSIVEAAGLEKLIL